MFNFINVLQDCKHHMSKYYYHEENKKSKKLFYVFRYNQHLNRDK